MTEEFGFVVELDGEPQSPSASSFPNLHEIAADLDGRLLPVQSAAA